VATGCCGSRAWSLRIGSSRPWTRQARHNRKTNARSFDGYKGHIAIDPDTEIITATGVTPGNSGDAEAAEDLLTDILPAEAEAEAEERAAVEPAEQAAVYGDAAYGAGEPLELLDNTGIHNGLRCGRRRR
jgi:DDE family transposase